MKKVKCKKCGSDNLLITGQLNPNDDNTIREYFSDAYASAGGSGFCCDCGDVRDFEVVDDVHDGNANDPWRCRNCGSLSVQQRAWVDVNTREIDSFIDGGRDDYWCETCEKHDQLVRESELLNEVDHWFENGLKPGQDEIISGLDRDDYNSDEEWNAECKALWDARDNESKIDIWHELTRDKPDDDGQWTDNYVLVEFPEDSTYFEDNDIGYPCFNSDDNGARYVEEEDYREHFKKSPAPDSLFRPVQWPESQNFLESDNERCEVILADEKSIADFGGSAVWVPVDLLNKQKQ